MSWYRGTEAPMDTSPAGPRQRSIFDDDGAPSWVQGALRPSDQSGSGSRVANAGLSSLHNDVVDVEMSSLTPPSQKPSLKTYNHVTDVDVDDSMESTHITGEPSSSGREERIHGNGSVTVHKASRRRGVLSRKGKRLAQLQSRETHHRRGAHSDNAHDLGNEDEEQEDHDDEHDDYDDDEQDEASDRDTPSRFRSITKYAVNYILPGAATASSHSSSNASGAIHQLDKPELLLGYAQFVFNASILAAFLYLLYHVVRTVQRDVSEKVRGYEMDMLSEITACAAAYTANRCGTELQAPALANACKNWERCSARDPAVVGTARVTAETFAEILNGFVDAVSWKAMLFTLLSLSIFVGATNSTLAFFRIKSRSKSQTSVDPIPNSTAVSSSSTSQAQLHHHAGMLPPTQPHTPFYHPAFPHHYPNAGFPNWQVAEPPMTPSRKRQTRLAKRNEAS